MRRPKALISTIEPVDGGVPTMTRWIIDLLDELEIDPVLAWYEPWSSQPSLSVPLHALVTGRRPGRIQRQTYGAHPGHGIGAWLPELEFTHYLARRPWRELVRSCDLHLAVTGSPLCATPYAKIGIPFLAWVASPWEADRSDRVKNFPYPRRILDQWLNGPVLRRMEREILQAPNGRVLALSHYTAKGLEEIAQRPMDGVMLMPVDSRHFRPDQQKTQPWKIGFSGRYGDPRKNIGLLLEAVRILTAQDHPVQLELVGEKDITMLKRQLTMLGIQDRVHCHPHQSAGKLGKILQQWDLFVIPSHQEGLCIAALEAMACGAPVVSTRCGGPEEFVVSGQTGQLVDRSPEDMAAAIESICHDRARRRRLSDGAVAWVQSHASQEVGRGIFRRHLLDLFPLEPS